MLLLLAISWLQTQLTTILHKKLKHVNFTGNQDSSWPFYTVQMDWRDRQPPIRLTQTQGSYNVDGAHNEENLMNEM